MNELMDLSESQKTYLGLKKKKTKLPPYVVDVHLPVFPCALNTAGLHMLPYVKTEEEM